MDFPGGASGKEPACQCRRHKRHGFDPWIRKIPWRRAWQPTPVFLPGGSHGQRKTGGLQSMGSQRVRHDWSDLACMHAMPLQSQKEEPSSLELMDSRSISSCCLESLFSLKDGRSRVVDWLCEHPQSRPISTLSTGVVSFEVWRWPTRYSNMLSMTVENSRFIQCLSLHCSPYFQFPVLVLRNMIQVNAHWWSTSMKNPYYLLYLQSDKNFSIMQSCLVIAQKKRVYQIMFFNRWNECIEPVKDMTKIYPSSHRTQSYMRKDNF